MSIIHTCELLQAFVITIRLGNVKTDSVLGYILKIMFIPKISDIFGISVLDIIKRIIIIVNLASFMTCRKFVLIEFFL